MANEKLVLTCTPCGGDSPLDDLISEEKAPVISETGTKLLIFTCLKCGRESKDYTHVPKDPDDD